MTVLEIIAQILSVGAFLMACLSYVVKKKNRLLLLQILANILHMSEYSCLGAWAAAANNLISIGKFSTFAVYEKKKGEKAPFWVLLLFTGISLLAGILTYEGTYSLVPLLTTIAFTVALWQKNPVVLRIIGIGCALVWIIYNFLVRAYASMFFTFTESVVLAVTLIREARRKKAASGEEKGK